MHPGSFDPSLNPTPSDNIDKVKTPEFPDTTSLLAAQKNLLCAHHFGHVSFDIQQWAWDSKYDLPKLLGHCHAPLCLACQYGQAQKKPNPSACGGLSEHADSPGAFVSVDHMVSGTSGHILFHVGCPSSHKYKYCSLWADHYSKFLFGHLQEHAKTHEMIQSKEAFESLASCYNVHIKHVHSYNRVFASAEFAQHLDAHAQSHSLCGISAHWQNGIVKQYISVIMNEAHTMLLHAMTAWPKVITAEMWTFAFKLPSKDNKCPYKLFTGKVPSHHLSNFCVFGCPAYVLKKNLADDNAIPKWKACTYRSVYIRHSDQYSSSITMIWSKPCHQTCLCSIPYHL